MKKNYRFKLSLLLIIAFSNFAIAQTSLGSSKSFMNNLKKQLATSANSKSASKTFSLEVENSKSFNGTINYKESNASSEILIGEIKNTAESSFYIKVKDNALEGHIILSKTKEAYKYYSDAQGNAFVAKVDINTLICIDYKNVSKNVSENATKTTNKVAAAKIAPELLNLQSLPGAAGCVLLDFDGYYMPAGNAWNNGNPIDAAPSGMSDAEIQRHWEIVAEDFRPFNLNITTNEAVYNSYPKNRRMRTVITPTNAVYSGGIGGVAYVGSFNWDNDVPCWVFDTSGKGGETSSHEIGHTFDLTHDGLNSGEEYYVGLPNTSWAPIMGTGSRPIVQWSKGEYNNANNKQDDVAIIAGAKFGIGYRADDYGNTTATAANLDYNANGVINQKNGIISSEADRDFFTFTTVGGNVSINANTVARDGNLHLLIRLYNAAGVEMRTYSNPDPFALNAAMNINLPAGKYFISVNGTGAGNPASGGYSAYGSIGSYSITGTISPSLNVSPSTDVVTVYKDFYYSGFSGGLTIGDYNLERLNSLGVLNDDISSLKIAQGFQAILYQNDNFTGASIVMNSDNAALNTTWNDQISSIRILANGVTTLDNQTFFLQNRNSELNMEVDIQNADYGIIQGNTNKDNQKYKFTHLGDGLYLINSMATGAILSVKEGDKANGANVEHHPYIGNANQQFVVIDTGDGFYKFIARHSGKLVVVAGASKVSGAKIQQWENVNQTYGHWKLISTIVPDKAILIQAEDYSAMSGVITEATTDVGGGLNVTGTDLGDSMTYNNINFPTTGTYLIEYRIACAVNGAQIFTYLNKESVFLGNVNITNTGGWQNWQTVTQTVNVNAGTYNFEIYVQNKSMNINWIRISPIETQPSTLIQAEDYTAMSGIKTETTTDAGGGLNVTDIHAGDWLKYANINFPTSGSYLIEYRVASVANGAQIFVDLNNAANVIGNVNIPYTGKMQKWQTVEQTVNVNAGTYNLTIQFKNENVNINWIRITKITSQASTLIQAEDFSAMSGTKNEVTADVGGGLSVTNTDASNWLGYSNISFPTAGSYLIEYRVASAANGGQIFPELNDGGNFLEKVTVPNTGGSQNWQTVKQIINIKPGTYNLTIHIQNVKFNINWIRISKIESETTALIQAEDYSTMSGIKTETTTDVGGGLNVTDTKMGDSLMYNNVNFPTSGTYLIEYRVASTGEAKILTYLNNQKSFLGHVDIPNTRGWQNWQTVTQTVNVDSGTTNLFVYIQSNSVNINWIRITRIEGAAAANASNSVVSAAITEDEVDSVALNIYPNPVSDVLFFTTDQTGGNVSVFDSQTGSLVVSQKINDNNLNVSGLRTGIYLIVFEKDGTRTVKRFIKK
ncbi:carbohydrate-binding protein [Flavobacterium sp. N1736]|uniref:carbohydrate-binding protein n=1 Tax=Flavobacterium sp. N1736 TaxID=2986823 RepID=UPI0022241FD7|nr:carbohydrate-binding protein [Flavobacterium sp. N1736]